MDQQTRSHRASPEELFAEAAERIQAGEPLELVLASYPEAYQRALRDLLSIVAAATEIHDTSVPAIALERRTARKAAFLQAASVYNAERTALARLSPSRPASSSSPRLTAGWPALRTWLDGLWSLPGFRPLAATLSTVLVLILSSTLITLAESAVPGDLSYPVKQWIRNQQLYLAPEEEWAALRQAQEQELVEDVQKAQIKADRQQMAITVESVLLFHGYGAGYWDIGDLRVLPEYRSNPDQAAPTPMTIIGDLTPGATVRLRYQIIPGQQAELGARVVQGIELVVISTQPLQPTPIPTETLLPPPSPTTIDAPTLPPCQVLMRPGWVPYTVRIGDTLSAIGQRTGASVAELSRVNCLTSDHLVGGRNLLVPGALDGPTIEPPPPAATPFGESTPIATPDAATVEPGEPTEAVTISPGESTPAAPDETLTPGTLPELSPTAAVTIPTSVAPTTQSPAATSVVSVTTTVEPGTGATAEAPLTPLTGTPDATVEEVPTAATEAVTPTPTPTGEQGDPPTPTTDATPVEGVPIDATEVATPTPLPTEAPPPTLPAEGGEPPVPTPTTATDDPSSAPTAEAPTPAPNPPDSGGDSGAPPIEPTPASPPESSGPPPGQEPSQPRQPEPPAPPREEPPPPAPQDPPTPPPAREEPPPPPPPPPPAEEPPPPDSSEG